jgi:hypothetical protein
MGRVEETWVIYVGVAVVVDKNDGGVLIKVEICDIKNNKMRGENGYRSERESKERCGRRRWMEAN